MKGEERMYSLQMSSITRTQNLSVIRVAIKVTSLVQILQRKVNIYQSKALNNISKTVITYV